MNLVPLLPSLNAGLNATALGLLLYGYHQMRIGGIGRHRQAMIAAFVVSSMFLISYLTYRWLGDEKRFTGRGWIRPVYFFILITHVVAAPTVPFLAARTLYLAVRGRIEQHRRMARVTFPIWVYVSVTGVLVYVCLFLLPLEGPPPATQV